MDFINWFIAHTLCMVGFVFLYIIANKLIHILKDTTKKVCCILLFVATAFYVFGYLTPINPFAMIILAYLTLLICIAVGKYAIGLEKKNN